MHTAAVHTYTTAKYKGTSFMARTRKQHGEPRRRKSTRNQALTQTWKNRYERATPFGKLVLQSMADQNISLEYIREKIGTHYEYFINILTGQSSTIYLSYVFLLSDTLHIPVEQLIMKLCTYDPPREAQVTTLFQRFYNLDDPGRDTMLQVMKFYQSNPQGRELLTQLVRSLDPYASSPSKEEEDMPYKEMGAMHVALTPPLRRKRALEESLQEEQPKES